MVGGCCHLSPPPPQELCWAFDGPATPSWLSQHLCPLRVTAREGRSGACRPADGLALWDMEGIPYLLGCPNQPCCRCPQAVPAQGAGCLWRRRVPTPWRNMLSPARGHDVPPTGTTGTSQALASNVHEERGGGQGRPVLGEQVDVTIPWGQRRGLSGCRGPSPSPGGQQDGHPPTFPHAGQGQGELPHEVVAGGAVVVLHHEAHQGQLRHLQLEAQRLLPAWVEAYGTRTGGWALPPRPSGPPTALGVGTSATLHCAHPCPSLAAILHWGLWGLGEWG